MSTCFTRVASRGFSSNESSRPFPRIIDHKESVPPHDTEDVRQRRDRRAPHRGARLRPRRSPRVRASARRLRDRARGCRFHLLRMVRVVLEPQPRAAPLGSRGARRRRGPRGEGALADRHRASPPLRPGAHARLARPTSPVGHPRARASPNKSSNVIPTFWNARSDRRVRPRPRAPAPRPGLEPATSAILTVHPTHPTDHRRPTRASSAWALPKRSSSASSRSSCLDPKDSPTSRNSSARPCGRSNPRSGSFRR